MKRQCRAQSKGWAPAGELWGAPIAVGQNITEEEEGKWQLGREWEGKETQRILRP